jgi:N-acetylneuraminate synthase
MTLDLKEGEFFIDDPDSLWQGQSLHSLYQKAHTPWEWHESIFKRAHDLGLIAFSTAYDETAVDFLETLNVPCYKVASFENVDLPLIRKIAATGKPMIISTGMATVAELEEAVQAARRAGCNDLVLLKCTSTYPATPENSNLLTLPHMRELFECEVGLSDHTMGIGVAVASIALGATVIEKHFTLSRAEGGVDAAFSLEPDEMAAVVKETRRAWQALGKVNYGPTEAEQRAVTRRRSLYVTQNLKAGDVLMRENVRSIRPGHGLPPKYVDQVLGMKVTKDVSCGTPLEWDLLK